MRQMAQEIRRLLGSVGFISLLVIMFLCTGLAAGLLYYDRYPQNTISLAQERENVWKNVQRIEKEILAAETQSDRKMMEEQKAYFQRRYEYITNKEKYHDTDYDKFMRNELDYMEWEIQHQIEQGATQIFSRHLAQYYDLQYRYEHHMEPEEGNGFQGWELMTYTGQYPMLLGIYLLLALLGAMAAFARPGEVGQQDIWKTVLSRYIALTLGSVLLIAALVGGIFSFGSLFGGMGDGLHPIVISKTQQSFIQASDLQSIGLEQLARQWMSVVPQKELAWLVLGYVGLTGLFIAYIGFAAASLFSNRFLSVGMAGLSVMLPMYIAEESGRYGAIATLNHMKYARIYDMLTGSAYYNIMTGTDSVRVGALMFIFWGGLSVVVSLLLWDIRKRWFVRRDTRPPSKKIKLAGVMNSVRWRILLYFIGSIIIAVVATLILLMIAAIAAQMPVLGDLIQGYVNMTGGSISIIGTTVVVGAGLFILSFFFLMRQTIGYIEEISTAVNQISGGNFDVSIAERTTDELGVLAGNLNTMARRLKASIEEERNAERTKNELITSVSHDLRTPLTSILGYLGLIQNDQYKDEVELRYYVDIAYHKSTRLKKLIDDLFEFTRISGGMKANPTTINLGELLEQLAEEFVPIFQEAGMEYRLSLPRERVLVHVDGDLMVRVFENLITNAIRYGREGKYVDIELNREDGEAVVNVVNYGEPIPEGELPYIFERFYRVEKSRSVDTGGTGLGLAIAKNIVELHQGSIRAFCQNDSTTFQVRLRISTPGQ